MAKILFVSDVHIGIRYPYLVNTRTGISQRTMDFIEALERVVAFAIKEKVDIFVICGDIYDRVTVGPTLLRFVREKIWKLLIEKQIPIILIGGNHDSPQIIEKGSPFGEISIIPNSIVSRLPQTCKIKALHTKEEIGFILLPYLTATQTVEYVENVLGEEIEKEQHLVRSQEMIKEWIERQVNKLDTQVKILVGHFFFEGSEIGIIPFPEQLNHEFVIKKEMLPLEKLDLAVFGHIHTNQTMLNNKVIIPGSLERVDFGEKSEDKGFYIYDTNSKKLKFHSNNPRPLVRTLIEVPPSTENPTEFILQNFPKEIEEAVVRIEVKISPSLKNRVMIPKLHNELENKKSFHFDIIWITSTEIEYFVLPSLMLDPLSLFSEYISKHFENYKYLKELREKGFEILDKALSKVDELK